MNSFVYTDEEWEDLLVSGMKVILSEKDDIRVFFVGGIPLDKFTKEEIIKIFASWSTDKIPIFTNRSMK